MNIMKLADELLLDPFRIGADGKTASVLENSNAIASAGNSTLEPSASDCEECNDTDWRIRKEDDAPVMCVMCGPKKPV